MKTDFEYIDQYNNNPIPDFDGLSPKQMYSLLYDELGVSPIQVDNSSNGNKEIPLLKQLLFLLRLAEDENGIKMTSAGFLPPKLVKHIYSMKIIEDKDIEHGITKLTKEADSESIQTTRFIAQIAGYAKIRKGVFSTTKKGQVLLQSDKGFLDEVLSTFGTKYNMSYFDGYEDQRIAQIGFAFSIVLLSKYGEKPRPGAFYAKKYFTAFPQLSMGDQGRNVSCYGIRTFYRFLRYFGFVNIKDPLISESNITKTAIMDKYIHVRL